MYSKTGLRRLAKLADHVEALDPKTHKLEMRYVAQEIDDGRPACGSSACLLGWAATIPSFRRVGYRLVDTCGGSGVKFNDARGARAIEEFFDISFADAAALFGGYLPNNRKQAVRRLRKFVEAHTPKKSA